MTNDQWGGVGAGKSALPSRGFFRIVARHVGTEDQSVADAGGRGGGGGGALRAGVRGGGGVVGEVHGGAVGRDDAAGVVRDAGAAAVRGVDRLGGGGGL